MGFFDDKRVIDLTQNHLQEIRDLEEKEAKALIRRYREVRQELRDRLDSIPGDTFTAQQLRGVLLQVESAIGVMQGNLFSDMKESSEKAAIRGSDDLIRETQTFNKIFTGAAAPIDVDASVVALDTANYLVSQYESSLQAYSADVRANISRTLSGAVIEKASTAEILRRLGRFLVGEEWKLRQIARTELHNVYNMAKQRTLFEVAPQIPRLRKTLIHPMDNRTGTDSKQAAAQELIVDVDKPFKYSFNQSGKTITRVFMVPPDRPNDRSIMVPYRSDWDD